MAASGVLFTMWRKHLSILLSLSCVHLDFWYLTGKQLILATVGEIILKKLNHWDDLVWQLLDYEVILLALCPSYPNKYSLQILLFSYVILLYMLTISFLCGQDMFIPSIKCEQVNFKLKRSCIWEQECFVMGWERATFLLKRAWRANWTSSHCNLNVTYVLCWSSSLPLWKRGKLKKMLTGQHSFCGVWYVPNF